MGKGIRYNHVEAILKKYYHGGSVLEIAAGGCKYKDLFHDYIGTDLPLCVYHEKGGLTLFCDGQYLPFKDNTINFIFIVAALYQIPDTECAINEVCRVLKPHGQFLIFDYNKPLLKRLKKIESADHNHMWHPWELERRLKQHRFKTDIVLRWNYSSSSAWQNLIHPV